MNSFKHGHKALEDYEDNWETDLGAWFPGERVVFRGMDLFSDLRDMPWMGLLLFGITGRVFNKHQIQLFEAIWSLSVSFPDPRLWNNRIAALAGSARSTAHLGVSAALAVSEAKIYGGYPFIRCIDFLIKAGREVQEGGDIVVLIDQELSRNGKIYGYGRPIVRNDERIKALMARVKELGFDGGLHVNLAFEVEKVLVHRNPILKMNVAALMAALSADQNLTPREFACYGALAFSGGIIPCFIDSLAKPEGSFYPMRCSRIQYEGHSARPWE
jgi:citrate synthase